jgi:hypothetical protein
VHPDVAGEAATDLAILLVRPPVRFYRSARHLGCPTALSLVSAVVTWR